MGSGLHVRHVYAFMHNRGEYAQQETASAIVHTSGESKAPAFRPGSLTVSASMWYAY